MTTPNETPPKADGVDKARDIADKLYPITIIGGLSYGVSDNFIAYRTAQYVIESQRLVISRLKTAVDCQKATGNCVHVSESGDKYDECTPDNCLITDYKATILAKDREIEILKEGMKGDYDLDRWLDWVKEEKQLQTRAKGLQREIQILRQYGNKDCTAMADEIINQPLERSDDG